MNEETRTYHSRASTKHRYVTVPIPKVGCTTIKRALLALEGIRPGDPLSAEADRLKAGIQSKLLEAARGGQSPAPARVQDTPRP